MKVLNLYAGVGGNRLLWDDVKVTAVEIDSYLCDIYSARFPDDEVINTDAHDFLLHNYMDFDFIWSSPPCPTHSIIRKIGCNVRKNGTRQNKPVYPDMKLYQEIIFLKGYFYGKFCVENVMPYYEPLIKGKKIDRHYFWTNYPVPDKEFDVKKRHQMNNEQFSKALGFDLKDYYIPPHLDQRTIYRNCVDSQIGLYLFECSKDKQHSMEAFVK